MKFCFKIVFFYDVFCGVVPYAVYCSNKHLTVTFKYFIHTHSTDF